MFIFSTTALVTTLTLLVGYWISRSVWTYFQYEQKRRELGCSPLPQFPHSPWIPFGLDYVSAMMKAIKEDRFLPFQTETYQARRSKVWTANFLGNRMVYSSEPENMKAMSTSLRDCFAIEPIRVANGAITPFTGRGVSSSDGTKWQESRDLVMPYFDRASFKDLRRLRVHVDRLLSKIPTDGATVDMQPMFQRWFLDTSTEFVFGETVNSLDNHAKDWPLRDMVKVMAGLRVRLQLSSFLFLHNDKEWLAACHRIHGFLDAYIDHAYQQIADEERDGKPATYANGETRNDFLWTIAHLVPDKLELRTQLTGVWIPSNETTSILMSNTIWALARNPHVVAKLRKEILDSGADESLTFEKLRSLTYLRWTINEVHRLYPVSLQTVRACIRDCALPTGGGPDGTQPIFCAKGDIVHCNRYLMHRDPDIWGLDAEAFVPERWEHARPLWGFVPFGGGPRICPAHIMVDAECSYTVFCILRRFRAIEPRDDHPYTGVMRVGPSNKYGCKVGFVPAAA